MTLVHPCRGAAMTTAMALLAGAGVLLGPAASATGPAGHAAPAGATPPPGTTSAGDPVDLDVLFVGAHPDDEASALSTLGQWRTGADARAGVITITRGEGGGNAVGPEEGPALGLLREAEERRAVARAGVENTYNLDTVDFFYTVSAPLTEQVWGHDETLAKVVRLLRETRPEVVLTMDPAPSPGNHGHHQYAARTAIEAFRAAADPAAFPEQITDEGLQPWAASRIALNTVRGVRATGPTCPTRVQLADPAQTVYGVWGGAPALDGTTWAQVEREAQREYVSQGWGGFPDVSTDPAALGCDYFTQVDSRVPSARPGSPEAALPDAALHGALVRGPGAVPLGTGMTVDVADFRVVQGEATEVTVEVTAGGGDLGASRVELDLPPGWEVTGSGDLGAVGPGQRAVVELGVRAPLEVPSGTRVRLGAALSTADGTGWAAEEVEVVAPVRSETQLLPQVTQYHAWAAGVGVPQLEGTVAPVLTLPVGGQREIGVVVTNETASPRSGTVEVALPAGFATATPAQPFADLAAGASTTVPFRATSTDATLATSAQGGDRPYTITTTSDGAIATTTAALELVPTTTVPQAPAAPVVDGVESPGEYPGQVLDLSRRWEGAECASPADCSASAKVAWHADALSVLVDVVDDTPGTALGAADCKRHWRTDSVEIALDPRGTSENTSTTFKAAVLPFTAEGGPCAARDADAHQGPAAQTAPGMVVASTVDAADAAGTGYTVEVTIPLALLPAPVDPERLGMNLFVYDSDTQDRTGQTRIGWSTWQGVQGDPYRWGVARLDGLGAIPTPSGSAEPVIPTAALASLDSPQSIAQSVADDVPLAGGPAAAPGTAAWATGAWQRGREVVVGLTAAGPGTAHVFLWDAAASRAVAARTVRVEGPGRPRVALALPDDVGSAVGLQVLVGVAADGGGTLSSQVEVATGRRSGRGG